MTDEENTKGGIVCCVLFLVLIGAFLIYEDLTFKYDVYFDNGYENGFDIFIDSKNKGSVDPVSRVKISMSRGEHTIEIRKKNGEVFESNEVTLSKDKQYEDCKYIYNIGRKYFYYVELCEYAPEGGTKRGGWDTEDIGSETFMRYYADFDLDENCPKEITSSYGTSWTKSKLKRRINPTATELSGTAVTVEDVIEVDTDLYRVPYSESANAVLILYFDEGSGTVAEDESGYGNDGTIYGATWTAGIPGKALRFDGNADYVGVSNSLPISGTNEVTIEYWLYLTSHAKYDICGYIADRHNALRLGLDPNRHIFINAGTHTDVTSSAVTFDLNKWYHYAMTVKGGEKAKVYVNGELVFETTTGVPTNLKDMRRFAIGASDETLIGAGIVHHMHGIIDEVAIHSRVLTSEEIKAHCLVKRDGASVKESDQSVSSEVKEAESSPGTHADKTQLESSLVGYWNFDEDSGDVASDLSGGKNDGAISGVSLTSGITGNALSFTGEKNSYVEIHDSASLGMTDAMTISAWINPDKVTSYDRIVAKPHGKFASPHNMYSLIFDNAGHARFEGCIGERKTGINGVSKIPLNEWTHIAATYDGLRLKLYMNGNLESTKDVTGGICTNDMPIYIGCNVFYSGENFNGIIDEVRIYNYALTEDEIKTAMHSSDASP
jgi:hypothetical protein